MSLSRIDMRIDESIKLTAEKAAALTGMKSLTEYIVRLIEKDAVKVIKKHEAIVLENDVFDRFMDACDAEEGPNKRLLDAVKFSRGKGVE